MFWYNCLYCAISWDYARLIYLLLNSLNKLKEIFDKTKVEERKRLLEELGIVGNRTIHEIASHNGWKDGSTEKAALLGMLGAITGAKSGGSALSGLIAGGANEYAIGYLKKTKGKDWINKHPDTVQNISAAFGGILSKMAGGGRHTTGAYLSRMGNALGGANGFYLYYEDNIPDDVKNILLIQQLS